MSLLTERIERGAPSIIERASIDQGIETGILVVDTLFPIGRGQRQLIIGDRKTGKSTLGLDIILTQKYIGNNDFLDLKLNLFSIVVLIGKKEVDALNTMDFLQTNRLMATTTVVVATAASSAATQFLAPFSGCALGEFFRNNGLSALIIYDDLSKHAIAYRQMALLLRRPPGREAFPSDIFYLHARLLERAGRLNSLYGDGSLTALPIVETQAGDISAYIPTNIISITDGQLFLDNDLFRRGQRPAINTGLSVSRIGSSAQTAIMKKVVGPFKLLVARLKQLERFESFSSDLDQSIMDDIERGKIVTSLLSQMQHIVLPTLVQILLVNYVCKMDLSDTKGLDSKSYGSFIKDFIYSFYATVQQNDSFEDEDEEPVIDLYGIAASVGKEDFLQMIIESVVIDLENRLKSLPYGEIINRFTDDEFNEISEDDEFFRFVSDDTIPGSSTRERLLVEKLVRIKSEEHESMVSNPTKSKFLSIFLERLLTTKNESIDKFLTRTLTYLDSEGLIDISRLSDEPYVEELFNNDDDTAEEFEGLAETERCQDTYWGMPEEETEEFSLEAELAALMAKRRDKDEISIEEVTAKIDEKLGRVTDTELLRQLEDYSTDPSNVLLRSMPKDLFTANKKQQKRLIQIIRLAFVNQLGEDVDMVEADEKESRPFEEKVIVHENRHPFLKFCINHDLLRECLGLDKKGLLGSLVNNPDLDNDSELDIDICTAWSDLQSTPIDDDCNYVESIDSNYSNYNLNFTNWTFATLLSETPVKKTIFDRIANHLFITDDSRVGTTEVKDGSSLDITPLPSWAQSLMKDTLVLESVGAIAANRDLDIFTENESLDFITEVLAYAALETHLEAEIVVKLSQIYFGEARFASSLSSIDTNTP
jgi:proton translocating ATP synthase F1 alpha subunit